MMTQEINTATSIASNKVWQPAIYARLSDDDGRAGVSLSIEHQLDILKSYVKDKGWLSPKIFYDDDKTGTNFDRKGFQDMYAEAQRGNVNVIIIKDTSRFGRNWVKSGEYFEKIEEMGVRFISIHEGLDTADPNCPALKMLPFYFIFNEWHSATTSEKVKTVRTNNAKQGKYQAGFAPYGYQKDPNNKHKLVIDPYSANVVKRIFELRLQKYSNSSITAILNSEGILSPSAYSVQIHGNTAGSISLNNKWNRGGLNELIQNPVYKGDTVNGRKAVTSYKNKKQVKQPIDRWIVVENTHEPIVSREDWQKCNDMIKTLGRVRRTRDGQITPFAGVLICPDCGQKMRHNHTYYPHRSGERRRYDYYNCGTYMSRGKTECPSHHMLLNDLTEIVSADIRLQAGKVLEDENIMRERFYQLKSSKRKSQVDTDKRALKAVNKRLGEMDKLLQATFEKSVLGGLPADMFTELAKKYEAEKLELLERAEKLTASIEKQSQTENDVETYISLMKKHANITELDRATVAELIDHITVSAKAVEPREIVIHYNFVGCIENEFLC